MSGVRRQKQWVSWAASGALGPALAAALACGSAAAAEAPPQWVPTGVDSNAVFGAQGALTQTIGSTGSDLYSGAGAGGWLQVNGLLAPWDQEQTFRFAVWGALGGGGAGFDGTLGSEGAYGFRWSQPFSEARLPQTGEVPLDAYGQRQFQPERAAWHALVARIGYAMRLSHNDRVESSLIELPRLELGYQFLGAFAIEARAHAGLAITGQFASQEGTRPLGPALAWGGRLVFHGRSGTVDLGVERIQPGIGIGDDLGPTDAADARVCVFARRQPGSSFGMCGTGRVEQADIRRSDGAVIATTAVYAGVLVGVGVH
jgi:hypothetical protein